VTAFLKAQPKKRSAQAKADTAGKQRKALQAVVVAAERQARYLQAGAGAGVTHPTALLLALSVAHLREYLSGDDSALDAVPPDVAETLDRMAIVLAGTGNTAFLAHTEERLQRFRDEVRFEGRSLCVAPESQARDEGSRSPAADCGRGVVHVRHAPGHGLREEVDDRRGHGVPPFLPLERFAGPGCHLGVGEQEAPGDVRRGVRRALRRARWRCAAALHGRSWALALLGSGPRTVGSRPD
jgi:hypothetical protein